MLKAIVCLLCLILVLTVVLFGGCDDRRHPWHGLQPRVQSCGRRHHIGLFSELLVLCGTSRC